ncbi:MAG: FKBP-type peptidylprolyl isomerase, partial [Lachnospiraceae bacterium]|nr:FKBP-type peptidylprolyl isomerase [Lachnospiraceae bacterium]
KKITEAAKQFIEANSQATLENLAVTQADIETALELQTYEKKMFDPMVADVDTKVSDNEAQQTTVTYVTVEEKDTEEGGDSASDNEEKAKEATAKEKAQQILDEALATANADMDAIAKDVDEELSATETHFTANPPEKEDDEEEEDIGGVPQSVQDVVKDLADGEVASELVEEDGTYYVVRLEKAFDEESTNEKKDSIISERKQDMYDDMIEDWKDKADIQVDKKVLKTLKVTANRKFTFKQEEETEDVSDNEADQEEVSSNESEEAQDSDQGEDEAPEAQEKDTEE